MTAPEFPVFTLANLANLAKQTLERAREEPPALAPTEEASINARLDSITETDPGIRGEILERARAARTSARALRPRGPARASTRTTSTMRSRFEIPARALS